MGFLGSDKKREKLGKKYKERVSGFQGICIAEHHFHSGCSRYTLRAEVTEPGKAPEELTFDETELIEVKAEEVKPAPQRRTGGPQDPSRTPGR